jgi:3',5'-cyclic AMP phosphodiesterase CpdA
VLIAQITDTHVRAGGAYAFDESSDTSRRLHAAVHFLRDLDPRPDVVLATGDLVDAGTPEDYAQLRAILAPLHVPLLPVPGNHDARGPMREAFPEIAGYLTGEFLQYAVDDWPVRLVALDTLLENRIGGRLCEQRLAWIEQALGESTSPTIVFMHHPPYDSGAVPNIDMRCEGGESLSRIVADHPQVQAVLCGHLHRWTMVRFGGTLACTVPATAPLLEMNLRGRHPAGWVDAAPMVGLHLWREGIGLATHVVGVDEPRRLRRFAKHPPMQAGIAAGRYPPGP